VAKWVYQSVQCHTGLTHPFYFLTLGHSGAQSQSRLNVLGVLGLPGWWSPYGEGSQGGHRSPLYQRIRQCTVRYQSGSDMSNCEMPLKWDLSCQNPCLGAPEAWGSWAWAHWPCWIRRPCSVLSARVPECQNIKNGRLDQYGPAVLHTLKCNHFTPLRLKGLQRSFLMVEQGWQQNSE